MAEALGQELDQEKIVDQGIDISTEEQKAENLKSMMDEALSDGTVDSQELMAIQDQFSQDEILIDTSNNEKVQEIAKEFKTFQERESQSLFTQWVTIDKSTMSEERFDNLILNANLNCNLEENCIVNYNEQADKFTVKLVNGKFETEEVLPTNTEKLTQVISELGSEYNGVKISIENGKCILLYPEKGNSTSFTIDEEGNSKFLTQEWLTGLVDKKLGQWNAVKKEKVVVEKEDKNKQNIKNEVLANEVHDTKEKETELPSIKSIGDLKASLADKKIIQHDWEYYFTPKDFDANNQTDLLSLKNDTDDISSLEEVLYTIDNLPGIDLAFDESMNEKEKLALITNVLGRKIEWDHTEKFSTVELDSDFKEWMYSKEKFEEKLIKELNKIIPEDIIRSADQSIEQAIVDQVNAKLESYGVQWIEAKDLLLTHKNKVADLIKDVDIFDKIPAAATVIVKEGLFRWIPSEIDDNAMYEVNNGQEGESLESVKMSGSKLKELLASNDKKVSKAMEDNRESIKINETQLALEELGFTEFKDIDFEGKNENGQYEFSYEWETIFLEKADDAIIVKDSDSKKQLLFIGSISLQNNSQIESKITELVDEMIQTKENEEFKEEILKKEAKDSEKESKKSEKNAEKERKKLENEMEDLISGTEVSVKDLFGKEFEDIQAHSDEMTWLTEFRKSDLTKGIDLNDVKVDLSTEEVQFDFDDRNGNEDFNEKHIINIKDMVTDGKLDMDKFKAALKKSAADAVKRMKEAK